MADQAGLRFIGIGLSAVTVVVTLIAAFIVIGASPEMPDRPAVASIGTR